MEKLSADELVAMVLRVFSPTASDKKLAVFVDLPDNEVPDNPAWLTRRAIAREWIELLSDKTEQLGLDVSLVLYRNAHTNNGELPDHAWIHTGGELPANADVLDKAQAIALTDVLQTYSILLVPSQFSATAPLMILGKKYPFRAATMGGFCPEMIPALRLDYVEINRRVSYLTRKLDAAKSAQLIFAHPGGEDSLLLDLRFNKAHASSGLLPRLGEAGNLPTGEAYVVPFEGDENNVSLSEGILPVQFGEEIVRYRIARNKAVEVLTEGEISTLEATKIRAEPAYANLAELGLGVLAAFGITAIGKVLLDEKLGVHIAFGRSDHFGGKVGAKDFSSPSAVIHIDRVYVPKMQPNVLVKRLDLTMKDDSTLTLMKDGDYVVDFV